MREKLPYTFNSRVKPDTPEQTQRILQEMWQQIARVVNQDFEASPTDPNVINIASSISGAPGAAGAAGAVGADGFDLLAERRRWAIVTPTTFNTNAAGSSVGDDMTLSSAGSGGINQATATEFRHFSLAGDGIVNGSLNGQAQVLYLGGSVFNTILRGYLLSPDTVDIRAWFVLSSLSVASHANADAPNGHYMGFRFSTGAGDTNWQCVHAAGAAPAVVDSGVAPTATGKLFEAIYNPAVPNIVFKIAGATVATVAATLPASTVQYIAVSHTLDGAFAAKKIGVGWINWHTYV